jgi:hypothetical protein
MKRNFDITAAIEQPIDEKVTDGESNCRLHFVQVSFGPFEARV